MASSISAGTTSSTALVATADTTGALQLATNNGTVAVTVDTSQNVGIGTASPTQKVSIAGGLGFSSALAFTGAGYEIGQDGAAFLCFSGGSAGTRFINASTATEWMRIDSSGNVGIGTTSISARLNVVTDSGAAADLYTTASSGTPCLYVKKQPNDGSTSQVYIQFLYNSATSGNGQINGNGSGNAAFGSYSDRRLKENIVDLPPQLANIMALHPVEFDWKDGSGHQIGFIAQEVQNVYPDLVGQNSENEMLTLTDMNKNDARLIKAIQEQQALITSLTARIAALEGTPA
jgi:hypothetical protein